LPGYTDYMNLAKGFILYFDSQLIHYCRRFTTYLLFFSKEVVIGHTEAFHLRGHEYVQRVHVLRVTMTLLNLTVAKTTIAISQF
jgi:hypothetical protein